MTAYCSEPKAFPIFPTQVGLGEMAFSVGYLEASIKAIYAGMHLPKSEIERMLLEIPVDLTRALEERRKFDEKARSSKT